MILELWSVAAFDGVGGSGGVVGFAPNPSWQPAITNGTRSRSSHVDDITRIVVMFTVSPPVLIQIRFTVSNTITSGRGLFRRSPR